MWLRRSCLGLSRAGYRILQIGNTTLGPHICPYDRDTVLVTVALEEVLKPDVVSPPTCLFVTSALASLRFSMNFRMGLPCFAETTIGKTKAIAL